MERDFSDAFKVDSIQEEYDIAGRHKCECGGQLKFTRQSLLQNNGQYYDELNYKCLECEKIYEFLFDINSFFGKFEF